MRSTRSPNAADELRDAALADAVLFGQLDLRAAGLPGEVDLQVAASDGAWRVRGLGGNVDFIVPLLLEVQGPKSKSKVECGGSPCG